MLLTRMFFQESWNVPRHISVPVYMPVAYILYFERLLLKLSGLERDPGLLEDPRLVP